MYNVRKHYTILIIVAALKKTPTTRLILNFPLPIFKREITPIYTQFITLKRDNCYSTQLLLPKSVFL